MGETARIGELDYLRAYAVAMVMALHLIGLAFGGTNIPPFMYAHLNLAVGVDIFFVISGFVISLSLSRLWDGSFDRAEIKPYLWAFAKRRFWRLWPAAFVWLMFFVTASWLFHDWEWPTLDVAVDRAIAGTFYGSNFAEIGAPSKMGHYWSLSLEWQFYMVLPVFLLLIKDWRQRGAVVLLVLLLGLIWRPFGPNWWMFRIDGLLVGILVYIAYRNRLALPDFAKTAWRPSAMTAIMLVFLALTNVKTHPFAMAFVAAVLGGLLVHYAIRGTGYISTFGKTAVVKWAGSRSYSLYLAHIPMALLAVTLSEMLPHAVRPFLGEPTFRSILLVVMTLMAIVASEMTFRFIEEPTRKLGKRLATGTVAIHATPREMAA